MSKWMDSRVEHSSISIVVGFDIIFTSGTHFLNKLKDKEHNNLHTLYFSYMVWNHTPFFSF